MAELVLEAVDLEVRAGDKALLRGLSLQVRAGEVVALVGPSGSGKSLATRALLGLLPFRPGRVRGEVALVEDGTRVPCRTEADFQKLRGGTVGLLFQDARSALDPLRSIGVQVGAAARLAALDPDPLPWLARAGFPDPLGVAGRYPHELSGGMAQRAAIAIGLARRSRLLLADEPTTGLDPSVQRAILFQLRVLVDSGLGVLFITHDLRLLPGFADRILVIEEGRIVEEADEIPALRGPGRALVEATRKIAGGVL